MTSRDRQYLLDILIAAEDALSFVQGHPAEVLETSALVRRGVLNCLAGIGEAAGKIAEGTEAEMPDFPWRRMKNLRNVIVHDYEGVNLPIVWQIVTQELPVLFAALDPLFPERKKP